jgi:hypothetical protein
VPNVNENIKEGNGDGIVTSRYKKRYHKGKEEAVKSEIKR